jgi:hypothetical protein
MIRGFVKPVRALFLSGAVLTILGSFLPWGITGRMLIVDNGGLLIVLLTGVSVWLAFYAPKLIRRPQVWVIATTIVLLLVTIYHIADWELRILRWGSDFEAPVLREGLQIVLLGSSMLLFAGLRNSRTRGSTSIVQE